MDKGQITSEIRDYIFSNTFGNKEKLNNKTLIFQEGYFDSMGFVSLISFLEEKFAIQTNDEDLVEENFESIDAICNYVERKLNLG